MNNPIIQMMMAMIRQNPSALLRFCGFDVPTTITNPQQILQHLTQSGQVNQQQLDYAQQMAKSGQIDPNLLNNAQRALQMFGGFK